jgi:hypothetical protein
VEQQIRGKGDYLELLPSWVESFNCFWSLTPAALCPTPLPPTLLKGWQCQYCASERKATNTHPTDVLPSASTSGPLQGNIASAQRHCTTECKNQGYRICLEEKQQCTT